MALNTCCNNNDQPTQQPVDCCSINSTTIPTTDGKQRCPNHVYPPPFIKVPGVYKSVTVQVNVESDIRLGELAYDIKKMDKRVCLTQAEIIDIGNAYDLCCNCESWPAPKHELFLEGYVEKNIQYSTRTCTNNNSCFAGDIRHATYRVPFKVSVPLKHLWLPPLKDECVGKFDLAGCNSGNNNCCCPCPTKLCGNKDQEYFFDVQFYNDPPYAELVSSRIIDRNFHPSNNNALFDRIHEKMVVILKLNIMKCVVAPYFCYYGDGDGVAAGNNTKLPQDFSNPEEYKRQMTEFKEAHKNLFQEDDDED